MYNYFNENNQDDLNHNEIHSNNQYNNYDFSTLQKIRKNLIGEIQAIIDYDEHIHSTNDNVAKEMWTHIKEEELTHVGELLALLNHIDPSQRQYIQKGIKEFMEEIKMR